jgi:hypothetical protein
MKGKLLALGGMHTVLLSRRFIYETLRLVSRVAPA